MLKENQFVYVRWSVNSKEFYESRGYICENIKKPIYVKVEDLYPGSHCKVEVNCDFCNKDYTKYYCDYLKQKNGGDCCNECKQIKSKKILREKYGDDYMSTLNKKFVEKYGVNNPMEIEEFKNKVFNTNLERYGSITTLKKEDLKKAIEKSWSKESREKRIKTNLEKYGCEYGLSNEEIRNKIINSYYKNGTAKTSSQQLQLKEMLLKEYNNCEINYPCSNLSLDCFIEVDSIKIDIEYDGEYWHQDEQKDRRRDEFVKSQGYKILRIKGKHKVPEIEDIKEKINELIATDKKFCSMSTAE